jgi:arginyl-tRNA synthetase
MSQLNINSAPGSHTWLMLALQDVWKRLFADIPAPAFLLMDTHKDYPGDITLNIFPLAKLTRLSPEQAGEKIGTALLDLKVGVASWNVVKGFLNLEFTPERWAEILQGFDVLQEKKQLVANNPSRGDKVLVEFSSPNTNKPLHLGHLRNIFLGEALCRMLASNGFEVIRATLVNDRGIHICKSMQAWILEGNGETPQSSGIKGDHLVGKYYVRYETIFRAQVADLVSKGLSQEDAENSAPILLDVRKMLTQWEAGDESVLAVWRTMNGWVYEGFNATYQMLDIVFDKTYYESQTYLLGKSVVEEGLQKGLFFRKDNGSVWVDLKEWKLDEKLLLRGDGTSVYITQDIGTARLKFEDYGIQRSVYVIGNEQEHQMKALFAILKILGESYADGLFHLSYGMVELPSGKMKSREGTVVDADDLISEMIRMSEEKTQALGKTQGMEEAELQALYKRLGLGALRYFLLKVDPHKGMLFNPEESIDFKGNTGPFIQYSYARIQSLLRKAGALTLDTTNPENLVLDASEKSLMRHLIKYGEALQIASTKDYDPGRIANYVFELASRFGRFYNEVPILKGDQEDLLKFRLSLCHKTGEVIQDALYHLGIEAPERM